MFFCFVCLFVFCLFCLFLVLFLLVLISKVAWQRKSFLTEKDFVFPFCIENPISSEDKENTDSAAANTDTFDAGVLAGMAETIAICWGGIKDKLEKVSSLFV